MTEKLNYPFKDLPRIGAPQRWVFLLFIFSCLCSSTPVPADPIPIPQPFPVDDYIRGTYGEPLCFDDNEWPQKGNFSIASEIRYGDYHDYWTATGRHEDLEDYDYSRTACFVGCDAGLGRNMAVGMRIPFIWRRLKNSSLHEDLTAESFGDLLIRVRAMLFEAQTVPVRISVGAGIKIATGNYRPLKPADGDYYVYIPEETRETLTENIYVNGYEDLPTGTGSTDLCFLAYGSFQNSVVNLSADIGYVLTGTAEYFDYVDFKMKDKNWGDVLTYDLAVARTLMNHVSFIMELNGFLRGALKDAEGDIITDDSYRLSITPGLALCVPSARITVEAGLPQDLAGENVLQGTNFLLRLRFNRQIPGL